MNERSEGTTLSTADMVAATEPRNGGTNERSAEPERSAGAWGNGQTAVASPPAAAAVQSGQDAAADHTATDEAGSTPLVSPDEATGFRSRWDLIQTGFVDEPRQAVERADGLVAEAIKRLAEVFAEERSGLEQQWSRGDEVDTDALRQAMLRYRSFFQRLLAV